MIVSSEHITFLSHLLNETTPGFGGDSHFHRERLKQIKNGDSSNSEKWFFHNHLGTHIDFPYHFIEDGRKAEDYPASFWIFNKVGFVENEIHPAHLVGAEDIGKNLDHDIELLLFKSGFERYRLEKKYWEFNPGLEPQLAFFLREKFPKLRAIGVDFISISSFQQRSVGRTSHQHFLGGDRPILVIEDMKLSEIHQAPEWVVISPLRVEGADGSPVTILAKR